MSENRSLKAAIIQHPPVFLNIEESIKKACNLIEQAASEGANLIVFPETWLPGYPVWFDYSPKAALWGHHPARTLYRILVENSITIPGKHVDKLLKMGQKTKAYIAMGAHELVGGTLYNTMLLIDKGGKFLVHRKLVPTYTERLVWGRGDGSTLQVLNTEYGSIGGLICWEHWMPLARAAMHARGESIHIAQWPSVKELHDLASRHYAFEGQCFVLAAGTALTRGEILEGFASTDRYDQEARGLLEEIPGGNSDLVLKGGSAIIAPNASHVSGPVYDRACIVYGEIQLDMIAEGHLTLDTNGHYSRPDVFHLEVNDQPQPNVVFKSNMKTNFGQ